MNLVRVGAMIAAGIACVTNATAQDKTSIIAARQARIARTESLQKGPVFRRAGAEYRIVGGIRALTREHDQSPEAAVARVGIAGQDIVESKDQYTLFRGGGATPRASAMAMRGAPTLPVAVNVRTGGLGIVPGRLMVALKAPFDPTSVASALGLEIVDAFPGISRVSYRVGQGADIQAVAAKLAQDSRVKSVEIEVMEHFPVPL